MKQKNRGAVLISIQPRWCELIANGKKTVEVRKTKPKLDVPFKVYIYCTKARDFFSIGHGVYAASDELYRLPNGEIKFGDSFELAALPNVEYNGNNFLNGKVIGEFVCNNIDNHTLSNLIVKEDAEKTLSDTCLTKDEVLNYLAYEKGTSIFACKNYDFYGWHISDLVIYDEPKDLSEFINYGRCPYGGLVDCKKCEEHTCLKRPPQSWCYVEEDGGSDA